MCGGKSCLEHDLQKLARGLDPEVESGFLDASRANKELERLSDSIGMKTVLAAGIKKC